MIDKAIDPTNIACQLTAQGRGAIATIWIRGPSATETVDRFFRSKSGRSLGQTPPHCVMYGVWLHDQGPEDVIVVRQNAQTVEIHSHGGSVAPRLILGALCRCGFVEVVPHEALQRIHGNPWQASAVEAVQQALTLSAANRLLQNADGRLVRAIDELQSTIDSGLIEESIRRVLKLRRSYDFGSRLVAGWKIAIAGRPNVGKSSLINRLAGFPRSIVFDQPGTTRDVVQQIMAIGGWPIQVCDTAGLRSDANPIERIGIQSAKDAIQTADLTIWLSDLSQPWSIEDQAAIESIPNILLIHNKSDLATEVPSPPLRGRGQGEGGIESLDRRSGNVDNSRPPGLIVSLLHDPNINSILAAIEQKLLANLPPDEMPFLIQAWQADVMDQIADCLERGDCAAAQRLLIRPMN